jgi:hypothetical protein
MFIKILFIKGQNIYQLNPYFAAFSNLLYAMYMNFTIDNRKKKQKL